MNPRGGKELETFLVLMSNFIERTEHWTEVIINVLSRPRRG